MNSTEDLFVTQNALLLLFEAWLERSAFFLNSPPHVLASFLPHLPTWLLTCSSKEYQKIHPGKTICIIFCQNMMWNTPTENPGSYFTQSCRVFPHRCCHYSLIFISFPRCRTQKKKTPQSPQTIPRPLICSNIKSICGKNNKLSLLCLAEWSFWRIGGTLRLHERCAELLSTESQQKSVRSGKMRGESREGEEISRELNHPDDSLLLSFHRPFCSSTAATRSQKSTSAAAGMIRTSIDRCISITLQERTLQFLVPRCSSGIRQQGSNVSVSTKWTHKCRWLD